MITRAYTSTQNDTYTNIGEGTAATGQQLFEKFPKAYQETLLRWNLDQLVLMADLAGQPCVTEDAAKAYYDAHTDEFEQTCFSAIQVATKDRADELVAQIQGGADFAAIAEAEGATSPTTPGGDQGCHAKGELREDLIEPIFHRPIREIGDDDCPRLVSAQPRALNPPLNAILRERVTQLLEVHWCLRCHKGRRSVARVLSRSERPARARRFLCDLGWIQNRRTECRPW